MLFFGARSPGELPYFGPLTKLPKEFIDINLAFSRVPGEPKRYVQDLLRERGADVARLLKDENTYVYLCGLKGMEKGVEEAFTERPLLPGAVSRRDNGLDWQAPLTASAAAGSTARKRQAPPSTPHLPVNCAFAQASVREIIASRRYHVAQHNTEGRDEFLYQAASESGPRRPRAAESRTISAKRSPTAGSTTSKSRSLSASAVPRACEPNTISREPEGTSFARQASASSTMLIGISES
jgi:hypothetical protein